MKRLLITVLVAAPGLAYSACPPTAEPIVTLGFDSRYDPGDPTRSEIDIDAEDNAKTALAPVEDFIADLTQRTDAALSAKDRENAACVVRALAIWAKADGLSDLQTETVELTIGSRLAALALVAAQVLPTAEPQDAALIRGWLVRRMTEQMNFWETAPAGAASGNLRAWAGLAGAAVALISDDQVIRAWSAWSLSYVACTAHADGSLPQEMRRRHLALQYQLHAVAPLVVGAALLERQNLSIRNQCGRSLDRIVEFTLQDVAEGGRASAVLSGTIQTVNLGFGGLKDFQLAWVEAWLAMNSDNALSNTITHRRPLRYSKLGGNQTRLWAR